MAAMCGGRAMLVVVLCTATLIGIASSQTTTASSGTTVAAAAGGAATTAAPMSEQDQINAMNEKLKYAITRCKVCFLESEGSPGQCSGASNTCSGWSGPSVKVDDKSPKWTDPFRDDTDHRGGGCEYTWRLICDDGDAMEMPTTTSAPDNATGLQANATVAAVADGNMTTSAAPAVKATTVAAPASVQAQLDEINKKLEIVVTSCKICFKETEGSDQCQGARDTCSGLSSPYVNETMPAWTEPFRDDTDRRPGGCMYQWRVVCQ